jgi:hypothetical protein
MTIKTSLGKISYTEERARGSAHHPVILSGKLKADNGVYPMGLLLAYDANDERIPYEEISAEVFDTGDGNTKDFANTFATYRIQPGSVVITDDTETFSDDGNGRLWGNAGGFGFVDYKTGDYRLSFMSDVADQQDITADYSLMFAGVLDEETDTLERNSGVYIRHGSVLRHALKVGKTAQAEPTESQLRMLIEAGVYPE